MTAVSIQGGMPLIIAARAPSPARSRQVATMSAGIRHSPATPCVHRRSKHEGHDMSFRLLLLGLTLCAAACAPGASPRRLGPPPPGIGARFSLFVSPAGEPFRRAPGRAAPIAAWFAGADSDGDGALSFTEFQADFRRWFAALDSDHDGEIAPAEVTRYETEILPEIASSQSGFGAGRETRGPPPRGRGAMGGRGMRRG